MSAASGFSSADFETVAVERQRQAISRPSLSYWQDSWRRLKQSRRTFGSLGTVVALGALAVAGPWVWPVDPAAQDVDQISQAPSLPPSALITEPYAAWGGTTTEPTRPGDAVTGLRLAEPATTQAVRLVWEPVLGAAGYVVYRSVYDPAPDRALGLPIGDVVGADQVNFEDRLDLEPRRYWYSVVVMDEVRAEQEAYATFVADLVRTVSAEEAELRGWVQDGSALEPGDRIGLPYHPLGTDYLGRDMLARLLYGARVSLFIGVVAPLLFVLAGVVWGSAAGFLGGRVDQLLMRFADFVIALPFLLFMILFKIAFGIGPGESGVFPMLVALVLLGWPATARLVRGQNPAGSAGGLRLGVAAAWRPERLSRLPAHDAPDDGGDPGDAHLCGAERHLHRGVSIVHRHGRRAADAVVGQHGKRRHPDDALAPPRAPVSSPVHRRDGAGVQHAR